MCYNYPSVIEFQEKKERKIENSRFVPREFLFSIIDCSCVDGLYNIARTKISNSLRIEKGARLLDSRGAESVREMENFPVRQFFSQKFPSLKNSMKIELFPT